MHLKAVNQINYLVDFLWPGKKIGNQNRMHSAAAVEKRLNGQLVEMKHCSKSMVSRGGMIIFGGKV